MKLVPLWMVVSGMGCAVSAQTVALYRFEPSAPTPSTIVDDSGNHLDGVTVRSTDYTRSAFGQAIDLKGDLDYVSIPHSPLFALPGRWTVELFFRSNVPYTTFGSDPSVIITKHHTSSSGSFLSSYGIFITAGGRVYAEASAAIGVGTTVESGPLVNYNDGNWHHAALVFNDSAPTGDRSLALYVDYVLLGSVHGALPPVAWGTFPIYIGAGNYPGGRDDSTFRRNYDGVVDEVRISAAALQPSEFLSIRPGRFGLLAIENDPLAKAAKISWPTALEKSYQLRYQLDLGSGELFNLGGPFVGDGNDVVFIDPSLGSAFTRFYHVIEAP